jgi:hypothetical protein
MNESSSLAMLARINMGKDKLLEIANEQPSKLLALFGLDGKPTLNFHQFRTVTNVPRATCYAKWDATKPSFDAEFPIGSKKTEAQNSPLTFVSIEAIGWILKRRELRRSERRNSKAIGGADHV